jgi:hypothetical protein
MKTASNTFVLVSSDEALIQTVHAAVGGSVRVEVAAGLLEALPLASRPGTCGVIVDSAALRGQPVHQLTRLRSANPLIGILLVVADLRGSLLNDIQPLRVELLARPLPVGAIERFVSRTLSAGRLTDVQVGAFIEQLASAHKLNGSDLELFSVVLDRESPDALCARLNIDRAALSRGLRRLVKKCRVRNTDRLAKNLMRDALLFDSGAAPLSFARSAAAA